VCQDSAPRIALTRHLVRSSSSLTSLELLKIVAAAIYIVRSIQTFGEIFRLYVAAASKCLLLGYRLSWRCRSSLSRSSTEEHAGEPVSNGRTDGNGTGGSRHLSHHTRLLRLSNCRWLWV